VADVPARRVSRRDLLKSSAIGAGAIAAGSVLPAGAQGLTGSATAAATAATDGANPSGPLQLARVWFTREQAHLLAGFDDTHRAFDDGSIEILLWPEDLARIQATGLRHEVTVADLVARDAAAQASAPTVQVQAKQPGETATGDYRHLADYNNDMQMLAEQYPDKARLIELPFTTFERRKVYGLEIATNVHQPDGRAVYYNDGVHHSREWPAAEVPIMWAFDLLENYDSDPRIRNIVDHCRNIVVPVVNPDGFNYSREFPHDVNSNTGIVLGGQGAYVRKNRRSYLGTHVGPGLGATAAKPGAQHGWDVYGIDPNRNYGFSWGGTGSSADQRAQDARGDSPFSEPEARNVAHLLKTYQVTAMITHHTAGDLILWAWGDTYDDAPDDDLLQALGRACGKYNGYRPQKSIQLYPTTGTTADYAYGALGAISYTFEHAGSSFHPPYASTVPAMYAKNREALMLLCEEGCLPPERRPADRELPEDVIDVVDLYGYRLGTLNHGVLTGRLVDAAGNPVAGEIRLYKRFETLLWLDGSEANPLGQRMIEEIVETKHRTAPDGTFEVHVNPSTRPKLEFDGEIEAYELTARAGGLGSYREVVVRRGQRLDLGTITVR
jgi:hypothetical protein